MPHHRKVPSYCDCEEILFKVRKLLKDKTYSVFEDMPKEVYELRKAQFKKLQNAKERGDTAYFSKKYPIIGRLFQLILVKLVIVFFCVCVTL